MGLVFGVLRNSRGCVPIRALSNPVYQACLVLEFDDDALPTVAQLRSGRQCEDAIEKNVEPRLATDFPAFSTTQLLMKVGDMHLISNRKFLIGRVASPGSSLCRYSDRGGPIVLWSLWNSCISCCACAVLPCLR